MFYMCIHTLYFYQVIAKESSVTNGWELSLVNQIIIFKNSVIYKTHTYFDGEIFNNCSDRFLEQLHTKPLNHANNCCKLDCSK